MPKLTDEEFAQMASLLKRYCEEELDQFDHWRFNTKFGWVYVEVARRSLGPWAERFYDDLTDIGT